MKSARWLMVATGASMLMLGGCSDKKKDRGFSFAPDSPEAALKALHEACTADDPDAVAACFEPAMAAPMRALLAEGKRFRDAAEPVAKLVEKKLGRQQAAVIRGRVARMAMPSPLAPAVRHGEVNWDAVEIRIDGDKAVVTVAGRPRHVELKKVGGRWYAAPSPAGSATPERLAERAEQHRRKIAEALRALEDFQRRLNAGVVTKDNFLEEYDKATPPEVPE